MLQRIFVFPSRVSRQQSCESAFASTAQTTMNAHMCECYGHTLERFSSWRQNGRLGKRLFVTVKRINTRICECPGSHVHVESKRQDEALEALLALSLRPRPIPRGICRKFHGLRLRRGGEGTLFTEIKNFFNQF